MEACRFASFGGIQIQSKTTGQKGIEQFEVDVVGLERQSVPTFANMAPGIGALRRMNGYRFVEAIDMSKSC